MPLFRLGENTMMAPMGEEVVLLDSLNGNYYSLDTVGRGMLDLALAENDRASVLDALEARYDASREEITRDFDALMKELESLSLVARESV